MKVQQSFLEILFAKKQKREKKIPAGSLKGS